MRQRDQIESATLSAHLENASNNFIEFLEGDKLRDRQFADWNNKSRPQEIDLVIHPRGAISNFIGRGNAVAACRRFARETATNGGEINLRAHFGFVHSAKFFEPTEQGPACRPREWLPQNWLFHARGLADQYHLAKNGSA